jgi:hypothetical protein
LHDTGAPPAAHRWHKAWQAVSLLILGFVFLAMAVRQHRFVDRYSVNVMYGDQWDFYGPFENRETLWQQFDHQHGPHRQGVGCLLTHALADWDHWNSRGDSFGISFVLIAAAACGLGMAYCCGVSQPLALIPIPLLYLTRGQWEDFVCASNISHGSMPILLFTLYCLSWFIRSNWIRLALISILTFCLIFTGFGVFVGVISPMVLILEWIQSLLKKEWSHALLVSMALIACGISWWMFSWNYVFAPAVPDYQSPLVYPHKIHYLYFVCVMLSNFFGVLVPHEQQATHPGWQVYFGLFVMVCLIVLCIIHGWRLLTKGVLKQRTSIVIFCLAGYAFIYCVETAIGRVSLGWRDQAISSRYVTLMIPAGLAIYLHLATLKWPRVSLVLVLLYAIAIAHGAIYMDKPAREFLHYFYTRRIAWRDVYLSTHSIKQADTVSGFQIYGNDEIIKDRLDYLEKHHLNMFSHSR